MKTTKSVKFTDPKDFPHTKPLYTRPANHVPRSPPKSSPLHAVVVDAAVRAADCVDHAVDDAHADAVARHAHGRARQPAVVHGVVAVQRVGVHVAVGRVVAPAHRVEEPADDARRQAAARHLQVGQPQPGARARVVRLQVAERLAEVAAGRVDELRHLGRAARDALGGLVQRQVLEDLRQVVLGLRVPLEALQLQLQEVRREGVAAHGLQQRLHVEPAALAVVLHPGHAGVEHLRLAAHVQLVAADQCHQLAVGQVEELLLGGHLEGGERDEGGGGEEGGIARKRKRLENREGVGVGIQNVEKNYERETW